MWIIDRPSKKEELREVRDGTPIALLCRQGGKRCGLLSRGYLVLITLYTPVNRKITGVTSHNLTFMPSLVLTTSDRNTLPEHFTFRPP